VLSAAREGIGRNPYGSAYLPLADPDRKYVCAYVLVPTQRAGPAPRMAPTFRRDHEEREIKMVVRFARGAWSLGVAVVLAISSCTGPSPEEISSATIEGDAALASRLDGAAQDALGHLPVAGFSVAVARGGEVVLAKGYGYADLAERVPASGNTIYRLGSIGKEFTAAAVLRLAEEGELSLEDSITEHLPNYPAPESRITVRHLLSHTSGLSEGAIGPVLAESGGVGSTRDEIVALFASQPLVFEPGTRWSYSNSGFMLAGLVIESVSGTSYADHMTDAVLRPLGLSDTSYCPDEPPANDRWGHGYDLQEGNWSRAVRLGRPPSFLDAAPINMDVVYSAGALCSTVNDLVRWPALLRSSFLDPASFREMSTPTVLTDGTEVPYGLGLQLREFGTHRALAHGGVINGFIGMLAEFTQDDVTVALLVNTHLPSEEQAGQLLTQILRAVFDEPESEWHEPLEPPVLGR
jgi:D-alanyl-D-alanine carboxypeptidase